MDLVSSRLFFCLFLKRKAILSGLGSLPGRRSTWDNGGDVRGCSLRPGPGKCYLDGGDMQARAGEMYSGHSELVGAHRGANTVCCSACVLL